MVRQLLVVNTTSQVLVSPESTFLLLRLYQRQLVRIMAVLGAISRYQSPEPMVASLASILALPI